MYKIYTKKVEDKKKQSTYARRLLYDVLKEEIKEGTPILRGEHGKPYFENSDIKFSISHSGEYVCVAVARGIEIGVDIQIVQNNRERLASRFYADGELKQLEGLDDEERRQEFFRIWTRKEAILKADGCGITIDLNSFDVTAEKVELNGKTYTLHSLTEGVPKGYYISVAFCGVYTQGE